MDYHPWTIPALVTENRNVSKSARQWTEKEISDTFFDLKCFRSTRWEDSRRTFALEQILWLERAFLAESAMIWEAHQLEKMHAVEPTPDKLRAASVNMISASKVHEILYEILNSDENLWRSSSIQQHLLRQCWLPGDIPWRIQMQHASDSNGNWRLSTPHRLPRLLTRATNWRRSLHERLLYRLWRIVTSSENLWREFRSPCLRRL